jgi:hypothetical protein
VDWPALVLWRTFRITWGPSAQAAAKSARLNAYALARLAGWREQAHRFACGPIACTAMFLPAHPRDWHAEGAAVALAPLLEAFGDALNRPASAFALDEPFAVDFAPRLGIVIVRVTPAPVPVKETP